MIVSYGGSVRHGPDNINSFSLRCAQVDVVMVACWITMQRPMDFVQVQGSRGSNSWDKMESRSWMNRVLIYQWWCMPRIARNNNSTQRHWFPSNYILFPRSSCVRWHCGKSQRLASSKRLSYNYWERFWKFTRQSDTNLYFPIKLVILKM